jgi:3-oxoacyl-[acyl-carrier protein] reductase
MRLARAAWPHLKASRGSFVFISGLAGRTPHANAPVGAAVNGALRSFTKALAERALPDGIRVNAVCPGSIRTGRYARRVRMAMESEGIDAAEYERRTVARTGVTRIGEPEDIAGLVAFVASRRGEFLHGAIIEMDGGQTKTAWINPPARRAGR